MFWKLQEDVVTHADLDVLVDFIRHTTRFTQYTKVREFEQAYAAWQECRHCVFVNSGSSANLVLVAAQKALHGWQSGDEILVPAVTWPTTVTPVMQCGLTPVFVDASLSDISLDADHIRRKITPRTRGIFVAHLLGFAANIRAIQDAIAGRDIVIMEDCCEAQGARSDGTRVGNFGGGGTFSFYWGHHMTTVEGGMICTDDDALYRMCLLKRSHGLARELPPEDHPAVAAAHPDIDFKFLFLTDGFNVRNTEFAAVLGLQQLPKIDGFIATRNRNYARFAEMCAAYPDDLIVPPLGGGSSFVLPFLFRDANRKATFQARIREAGIESRPLISGNLLRQPFLAGFDSPGEFPNAEFLHTNAFYIGNNQFVDAERLDVLHRLMAEHLGTRTPAPARA